MTATPLPTHWPTAALPIKVAGVLLARFGAREARQFLQSARRAQPQGHAR